MALLAAMLAFVILFNEPSWLTGLNLLGEVVGGLLFLLIGAHLGRRVETIILRRASVLSRKKRDSWAQS
ncbi:hypothetical protein [Anaeromyxobacter terrae]|uniref:hypothetical protein n=1 Tax=Anaeromyxobacter terrae TaxID=2925406 RepID=UPI001F571DB0|nr:hypothetical protein [Anaeromyxobacter sp. SG22]